MKYIIPFFTLCLLFSNNALTFSGKYPVQNFSPNDYKAGIQNIDFAQNRNMALFVANNLGVLSYNGNDWQVHAFQSGKKVRSLAFDESTNRLYVGSQGTIGYLANNWEYVSLMDKIPESEKDIDEVWDVFLLNSKVYFCTFRGIYVYDGQSISVIEQKEGFNRSFIANGRLFVQNQKGQLFELKDQQLVATFPQAKQNGIIAGVIPTDEGLLLIYNSGDIEWSTSFGLRAQHEGLVDALRGKYVNHVLQLSDTRLSISTQRAGVYLYNVQKQTLENITTKDGLQTNACLRTFQDYSGNLWVGMQNGIAQIDINSSMRFINTEINLQGSGYEAFEVEEGTYFTTSNGIYFLAKNNGGSIFLSGTEGPAYGMQKLMGKLYAGHHTGLFLLENGKAKRLAETDGLWQIKPLRSKPGYVIGGSYSGLYLFEIGRDMILKKIGKIKGFEESSRFFEEDRKGRIWVGQFYKGLFQLTFSEHLQEVKVIKVSENYSLPIKEQIILGRIDNEIYLGTRAGLYHLDQTTDSIVRAKLFYEDIGDQIVYLIAQDNQKNIHVIAENRVGFYKQVSLNNYVFVPSSLFQLRYSLNNDLLNVSGNIEDGVFFNANVGFIHYKPEMENRVETAKPLLISKVFSVTENSIFYEQNPFKQNPKEKLTLEVSHKAKVLQFEVQSFHFNVMNNQQFRFLLKGFDEQYGKWTNMPFKEYSNLEEGEYEFVVQTRNALGEVLTGQPIWFRVQPPFYRSLLAKILYVAAGILILVLVSGRQKRRYLLKAKAVEKDKIRELADKQEELKAIERQKENELQKLEEDKMKSELRHTNNLLAASTMNLVVKNEFIEKIKEKLQEVNRKGQNRETKQALEQIVKEIDITLRLQEDWEQFEHHFDQVHGDFLARLRDGFNDLSPNEQKLCAFLRLNLNTKEIANLMGISLRGVEVARYRLRKKLNLNKGQNLSKFILEY